MSARRWLLGVGAALSGLMLAWALERAVRRETVAVLSPLAAWVPSPSLRYAARRAPRTAVEVVPVPRATVDEEPRRPHPITAEHRRIFRENELVGRLNAAMDERDFGELRRLNTRYQSEYPEDTHQLQPAYELIAACQEQQTADKRERAERWWSQHRSSTLRRYLRRYCLESES